MGCLEARAEQLPVAMGCRRGFATGSGAPLQAGKKVLGKFHAPGSTPTRSRSGKGPVYPALIEVTGPATACLASAGRFASGVAKV